MEGYRLVVAIQTRFRDTDAMGHVNNAVYLSYLELARLEYLKQVLGRGRLEDIGIILARVEIDYKSPALVHESLVVGVRVERLGTASFDMGYRIEEKASGRLVAQAKTVQVGYDYRLNKVARLDSGFLETVRRYDGLA